MDNLKDINEPALKSHHLTPQMIEKIGIAALIGAAFLTVATIALGFVAVLVKMGIL